MTRDARRRFLPAGSFGLVLFVSLLFDAQAGFVDFQCTQGGASRQIAVVQEAGYACRVRYTKPSGTSFPWSARHDADYCARKAATLVERLGSFGWACEAASEALALDSAPPAADPQTAAEVQDVLLAQLERYEDLPRDMAGLAKYCETVLEGSPTG